MARAARSVLVPTRRRTSPAPRRRLRLRTLRRSAHRARRRSAAAQPRCLWPQRSRAWARRAPCLRTSGDSRMRQGPGTPRRPSRPPAAPSTRRRWTAHRFGSAWRDSMWTTSFAAWRPPCRTRSSRRWASPDRTSPLRSAPRLARSSSSPLASSAWSACTRSSSRSCRAPTARRRSRRWPSRGPWTCGTRWASPWMPSMRSRSERCQGSGTCTASCGT
mmetsp:Transcript_17914/g.46354  ORF Transcript_17914/g.46354 Transcript_17914/m.46354 type:complete len:218 (+) Transcript_17914:1097-1750(+)